MSTPPLDRHEALRPFSRDHYVGLVQAQHLIKASDDQETCRRLTDEFLEAWASDIEVHFHDEEALLPQYMEAVQVDRLKREHAQLRQRVHEFQELPSDHHPDPAKLRVLGRALDDHIRWEERELFQALQEQCDEQQLAHLTEQTSEIEARRPRFSNRPD